MDRSHVSPCSSLVLHGRPTPVHNVILFPVSFCNTASSATAALERQPFRCEASGTYRSLDLLALDDPYTLRATPTALTLADEAGQVSDPAGIAPLILVLIVLHTSCVRPPFAA